jgi:Holliday junction resolvase RusA-like endonuclease
MSCARMPLVFTVLGQPVPQGSMKAFARQTKDGRVFATIVAQAGANLKSWRNGIANEARLALTRAAKDPEGFRATTDRDVAFVVTIDFQFPRPKSVTRRSMTVKPDPDKLARAFLDALTKLVWPDDAQVVDLHIQKHYLPPGIAPARLAVTIATREE